MDIYFGKQYDDFDVEVKIFKNEEPILCAEKRYSTLAEAKDAARRWTMNVEDKYGKKKVKVKGRKFVKGYDDMWYEVNKYDGIENQGRRFGEIFATYVINGNPTVVESWFIVNKIMYVYTITHRRDVVFRQQKFYKGDFEQCSIPTLRKSSDITGDEIISHIKKYQSSAELLRAEQTIKL